jgi:hypothetical protein
MRSNSTIHLLRHASTLKSKLYAMLKRKTSSSKSFLTKKQLIVSRFLQKIVSKNYRCEWGRLGPQRLMRTEHTSLVFSARFLSEKGHAL